MIKKPLKSLLNYSPHDLRLAANWIDRENKQYPLLNTLTLMQKLNDINGTLNIIDKETGYIKFWLEEKQSYVTRTFHSASELSIALSLGPVDLLWHGNLFLKTPGGNIKVEPIKLIEEKNQMYIRNLETDSTRYIWLNGAEKILANNEEGLTAGQIKLKRA